MPLASHRNPRAEVHQETQELTASRLLTSSEDQGQALIAMSVTLPSFNKAWS